MKILNKYILWMLHNASNVNLAEPNRGLQQETFDTDCNSVPISNSGDCSDYCENTLGDEVVWWDELGGSCVCECGKNTNEVTFSCYGNRCDGDRKGAIE